MAEVRVEHVFECTPEFFWEKIFFDAEFNRRMYLEELGFSSWKEVSVREDDAKISRVVEVSPPVGELPGPLKKLVGEGFGYREQGEFDKSTQRYRVTAVPNRLGDKLSVVGELWVEPVGESACRRIFEAKVVAKVFGVGGLLESRIVNDTKKNYEEAAGYTRKFLAARSA